MTRGHSHCFAAHDGEGVRDVRDAPHDNKKESSILTHLHDFYPFLLLKSISLIDRAIFRENAQA
jgi:hypothetical protein